MDTPQVDSSPPAPATSGGVKVNAPGAETTLILGILSIVLWWTPFAGLACGIVGLFQAKKSAEVLANEPHRYGGEGLRTAGFVCSIIGTVFSSFSTVYWLIITFGVMWAGFLSSASIDIRPFR